MDRALGLALLVAVSRAAFGAGAEGEWSSAEQDFSAALRGLRTAAFQPKDGAPKAGPAEKVPQIRSSLDFTGITWPGSLGEDDRAAIAAALNISGSFEADRAAWNSVTGNFDGQGLSLGLLNQCLGQGSLQPLLLSMRRSHPEKFEVAFSTAHLESINGMLDKWRDAVSGPGAPMLAMAGEVRGLGAFGSRTLSLLDEPDGLDKGVSPDKASVAWAAANLYKNGEFVPEWKAELRALAALPEYVSLQIEAALGYHDHALALEKETGIMQLRVYLLMFDFVVQNGGLHDEDISAYHRWVKANPKSTADARLEKILSLRLRHVRKKYVSDVRSRKRCVIRGKGRVHGASRDLPEEFGYDPLWPYKKPPPPAPPAPRP